MKIYLKRAPEGGPRLDGPAAILPDDALYLHEIAIQWVLRHYPDIPQQGAWCLVYVEGLDNDPSQHRWGNLLTTFGASGSVAERHKIIEARMGWLTAQTVQAVSLLVEGITKLLMADRLTKDELGN